MIWNVRSFCEVFNVNIDELLRFSMVFSGLKGEYGIRGSIRYRAIQYKSLLNATKANGIFERMREHEKERETRYR